MSSSTPNIVVVGPPQSGKKALVQGLLALQARSEGSEAPPAVDTSSGVVPWSLRTKYYDASLTIHILPSSEFETPGAATESALTGSEAFILVLDATAPETSFNTAATVWPALVERFSPGCMICCVNKCDIVTGVVPGDDGGEGEEGLGGLGGKDYGTSGTFPSSSSAAAATAAGSDSTAANAIASSPAPPPPRAHTSFLTTVQEWCLDNGFEFLEAAATSPLVGASSRDKTGVARILEALQSTMWSNMERRTGPGSGGGMFSSLTLAGSAAAGASGSSGSSAAAVEEEEDGGDGETSASFDAEVELLAMRQKLDLDGAQADSKDGENGGGQDTAASGSDASSSSSAAPAENTGNNADKGLLNLDNMLDGERGGPDIGRIMEQMRAVRDRAAAGNLSDEARREAAAAMALKLFELLGEGEEQEEGEDEEGVDRRRGEY